MAGGGIAGYGFHAGALAALQAATGWDPRSAEVVVGTSSGSIVAAALRAGLGPAELRDRVLGDGHGAETAHYLDAIAGPRSFRLPRFWRGPAAPGLLATEVRRGRRVRASNLVVGVLPEGRVPTDPLRAAIEEYHPTPAWPPAVAPVDRTGEAAVAQGASSLWIPATDLNTGGRIVFGRDRTDVPVPVAVEASCAIPGYFTPVEIDERRLVDGGMRSPDNAELLAGLGLDVVVISSPLSADRSLFPRSPLVMLLRGYPRRRLKVNVEAVRATGTEVLVLQPDDELTRTIGLNAMSRQRLPTILDATRTRIGAQLGALDRPPAEEVRPADHRATRQARDVLLSGRA